MKSNFLFPKMLLTGLFLVSFTLAPIFGQAAKKDSTVQKPKSTIPENVNAVLTNSCAKCHGETGRARPALDLSKWEEYSAAMKASKAKAIITTIDNGSMPPKGFLSAVPGAAVLKDQVELVRKWSETFAAKK
jgi:mono/diheme cytochrome c family protein